MIQNGIIFRDKDDAIWLGRYECNTIRRFERLTDYEGFYDDFPLEKFSFVEIEQTGDQLWIKDLFSFTLSKSEEECGNYESAEVTEILEDLEFPSSKTDDMFGSFLVSTNKAN